VPNLALLVDDVVSQLYPLTKSKFLIGRVTTCDIYIDDTSVSSCHAAILVVPNPLLDGYDDIVIEDLQSRNGTYVNEERIHRCILKPNDVISIGWSKFKLLDDRSEGRESTVLMMLDE